PLRTSHARARTSRTTRVFRWKRAFGSSSSTNARDGKAPDGSGTDVKASDERRVVAQSMERAVAIAERRAAVEIDPAEAGAAEDVVEVHAHPHEARGGPVAKLVLAHAVERRERVVQARVADEVAVDGRAWQRVEVADNDETVRFGLSLDEADEVLRLAHL